MKKKVRDLTLFELEKICFQMSGHCSECPLQSNRSKKCWKDVPPIQVINNQWICNKEIEVEE